MENIFMDRKASKLFYDILMAFKVPERTKFSKSVRDLFDKKIVSDGEYKTFRITKEDLLELKDKIKAGN